MSQHVGYIRVSSIGQNLERQLDGIKLDKVFEEKASAKDAKRPVLKDCMAYLREGDTLHVHSIDRLARNLIVLQELVNELTDQGVVVHFHKENLIFTGKGDNNTQKLLFQIIGAVAEFERAIIRERQAEGIAAAQAKGIHLGRPKKLSREQKDEIKRRSAKGENPTELSKDFAVSRATIYRVIG